MERKDILAICRKYMPKPHYSYNKVISQLKDYTENLGLSYDTIAATLEYWYGIKKSDPTRAGGGIGIVPYIYKEALQYWEDEKQAQLNAAKIQDYKEPDEITVQARPPYIQKPKTLKLFELK